MCKKSAAAVKRRSKVRRARKRKQHMVTKSSLSVKQPCGLDFESSSLKGSSTFTSSPSSDTSESASCHLSEQTQDLDEILATDPLNTQFIAWRKLKLQECHLENTVKLHRL